MRAAAAGINIAWCVLWRRKRATPNPGATDIQPPAAAMHDGSGFDVAVPGHLAAGGATDFTGRDVTTPGGGLLGRGKGAARV
jgi:hypothetical protein